MATPAWLPFKFKLTASDLKDTKFVFTVSFIILIITSVFSVGAYHYDEHFQLLEFAGLKLRMTEAVNLPWEYHFQMRPALQPAIVVIVADILKIAGIDDPFILATVLRIISSMLALFGMLLVYNAFIHTIIDETLKKWFMLLSFFLWFMLFNNVRFSSESWSGNLFLIGYSLAVMKKTQNWFSWLAIGIILGLSFIVRYQSGFLIFGFIFWHLLVQRSFKSSILMIIGIILCTGAGILIDRWYYSQWTITIWNYFYQNIILHKSLNFGVNPWWYYIKLIFLHGIPPFSLVYILSLTLVLFLRRKDLLTWTLIPYILIHFILGHKEIRFLFPLIGFMPLVIIRALEIIQSRWNKNFLNYKKVRFSAKLFWCVNLLFLVVFAFKPADKKVVLFRKLYRNYTGSTVLYYNDVSPFKWGPDIYFYKRPGLELVRIDSLKEISTEKKGVKLLLASSDPAFINELKIPSKMIYMTYPSWIKYFNLNNWMSRSDIWYIYELRKIEPPG